MEKPACPQILKSYSDMQSPNEPFTIHEGIFTLQGEYNNFPIVIQVNGSITYKWIPRKGVAFEGTVVKFDGDMNKTLSTEYNALIGQNSIGSAHVCSQRRTVGDKCGFIISGIIQGVVNGDKSVPVTDVAFSIPNFDDFLGSMVEYEEDGVIWSGKNRLLYSRQQGYHRWAGGDCID